MTLRPILTSEDPRLRERAARVRSFTPELRALIEDMIETMRAAPGVGLAAPQVGVGQRLIVVEYAEEPEAEEAPTPAHSPESPANQGSRHGRDGPVAVALPSQGHRPVGGTKPLPRARPKPPQLYVVVNPEIVRRSAETSLGNEGCLSIPKFYGEVERAERVTVRGLNRRGDPFQLKATGWLARIFQHEIDHLDGILFIDRAKEIWRVADEPIEGEAEGRGPSTAV